MRLKFSTYNITGWGFGIAFGDGVVKGERVVLSAIVWRKCYNLVVLK